MTRIDRLIALVSFLIALVVLFLLASVLSGHLGAVEFTVVIVVAVSVSLLISRLVRSARRGSGRAA